MNDYLALIEAVCMRMTAKPYTNEAVMAFDDIERIVGSEDIAIRIAIKLDIAEEYIRRRDDSDVWHIG